MKIIQIMSDAHAKTVIFRREGASTNELRKMPPDCTDEQIEQLLVENKPSRTEKKSSGRKRKSAKREK